MPRVGSAQHQNANRPSSPFWARTTFLLNSPEERAPAQGLGCGGSAADLLSLGWQTFVFSCADDPDDPRLRCSNAPASCSGACADRRPETTAPKFEPDGCDKNDALGRRHSRNPPNFKRGHYRRLTAFGGHWRPPAHAPIPGALPRRSRTHQARSLRFHGKKCQRNNRLCKVPELPPRRTAGPPRKGPRHILRTALRCIPPTICE